MKVVVRPRRTVASSWLPGTAAVGPEVWRAQIGGAMSAKERGSQLLAKFVWRSALHSRRSWYVPTQLPMQADSGACLR